MKLNIHFLNVGHGDSTVIEFPTGHLTMVDINNCKLDDDTKKEIYEELGVNAATVALTKILNPEFNESNFLQSKGYDIELTDPVDWLQEKGHSSLFRFVCTHPDMDHISGLHKIKMSSLELTNFWDVAHNFTKTEEDFNNSSYCYDDWVAYTEYRSSIQNPKAINPSRNEYRDFWLQDGIHILSPSSEIIDIAHQKDNKNHLSYVILITFGKTKIYLCGDATNEITIPYMLENYGTDFFKKQDGDTVILKAPHHGRESGYHKEFVDLINPDGIIVSVGKKPETDASNKYRQHCDKVWSTRWKGNISISCDVDGSCLADFQYKR